MKRILLGLGILGVALSARSTFAVEKPGTAAGVMEGHIMLDASKLEWKEGPPTLPKGTTMAVMEGDLKKEGPFTARFRFPAGSKLPPHTHPAIEHVTVISGTFSMGIGDKWDDKGLKDLATGSFAVMDKGTKHFAMTKDGAEVQLHGVGPWGITYVNPDDDPSKKVAKAAK